MPGITLGPGDTEIMETHHLPSIRTAQGGPRPIDNLLQYYLFNSVIELNLGCSGHRVSVDQE